MQNAEMITTSVYLTFTIGAGVVDKFRRDIVYEVVAEAPME